MKAPEGLRENPINTVALARWPTLPSGHDHFNGLLGKAQAVTFSAFMRPNPLLN